MLVTSEDGTVFDYDLLFLDPLLKAFDTQLRFVTKSIEEQYGLDRTEYLNQLDYLAGVGFTACQQYITAICRATNIAPREARKLPPAYNSDLTVVEVIHAGANYWKHHEEWTPENADKRKETVTMLTKAGADIEGAYICSDLIDSICGTGANPFSRLKQLLVEWRNNAINAAAMSG